MPRTILIVDDNSINRLMLANALSGDYDIIQAGNGRDALEILRGRGEALSAVLLDVVMPEMDGYEVLRCMRDDVRLAQIPVIMVTGSEDEASRIKALSLGANDFVLKPFNPEIVRHCLKNNIVLQETASTLNAMRRDKLTGLYNREAFLAKVGEMVAGREQGYYLISSFDIDNFKLINDQYGSAEGDRILREVGRTVSEDMEAAGGIAGRITGDNFAVLLPVARKELSITRVVQQNRAAFASKQALVFSVGRYIITDPSLPPSALYDRAYIAKQSVKGKYAEHIAYFDDAMLDKLLRAQQISGDVDTALAERQFEVWLQPQHNHSNGALVGAEALARWRHPERGLIPPAEFIPVFEQNGFIYELDKYVWEASCRLLRRWIDQGGEPAPISVNISRYDVFRPDFMDVLTGLVKKYDIPVELLRLEVTESAFAKSTKLIVDMVWQLIDKGFTVEIDDFGSGYSSLNTLKSVPAQVLKLDMHFLEDGDGSQRSGNILESIVRMAKWLGMSVIAEGVEDKRQADYLASIGCTYMQGYLYARPMPVADYEAYCAGTAMERQLAAMETTVNLDNNSFWDPKSMDTLIFNSYVGAACIFEYHDHDVELLRVNTKFTAIIGDGTLSVEETLRLDWLGCVTPESRMLVRDVLRRSARTGEEYTCEYEFLNIPGAPERTYLRATMRVIATAEDRMLVYCTSENITAQRRAEENERQAGLRTRETDEQLRFLNSMSHELLAQADAKKGITAALKKLMDYFQGNRAYIFEFDHERGLACNTYEVCAQGVSAELEGLQDVSMSLMSFWLDAFEDHGYYAVENISALDDSRSAERERLLAQDIGALFAVPLRRDGQLIGMIGVDDPRRALVHVERLSSLGDYIAVMLTRRDLSAKIQSDNETLTDMMRNMPGGFVRMRIRGDGSAETVYVNEGFLKLTDMSRAQLKALYAGDMRAGVHPEDLPAVNRTVEKMLADGKAHSARHRLRHGSKGYIWLSIFGSASKDASGGKYLNLYYADASEQVAEEETQKELLDNLPGGAAMYDFDGHDIHVVHINKRYWELVEREPAEYGLLDIDTSIHPDDVDILEGEFYSALEQGRDMGCEVRVLCGGGAYRPFRLAGRIVRKPDGLYAIYMVYSPISDEARSIQEMLPAAMQAVMDYSNEISYVKDRELRYISCSHSLAKLCGLDSAGKLLGKTSRDVFPPELAEENAAVDREVLASGHSYVDHDIMFPSREGVRRLLFSKYPLLDNDGSVIGVYGSGRDVTETRSMETRLELLNNSVPGGIAVFNGDPAALERVHMSYFSDGLCRLMGFSREEYESATRYEPFKLVRSEDMPKLYAGINALVTSGEPLDLVYCAATKDGGSKWINVKAVMGEPEGGELTVNAVFFDVTELRLAMEQLRVSEEVNRIAIQQSSSVVCRYDVASRRLTMPQTSAPFFAPNSVEEDVPYSSVREGKLSADTADAYVDFYERILHGEKQGKVLFQGAFAGNWRWMEAQFTSIFSDSGKPVTAVISFLDVTESIEKDAAYQKWQQSIRNRRPESYSLFHCNVTKDTVVDSTEGLLIPRVLNVDEAKLSARTDRYVSLCVHAEDRERFRSVMDRSALLVRFAQGSMSDTLDYRELLPSGAVRWLRLTVDLVASPYSADVDAYLLFEDIDEAKRAELEILERAENDPLTGVYNRATFTRKVNALIEQSGPDTRHALMMLDIDGFKLVNDVFGHGAGDQILVELAELLMRGSRSGDIVGRLGGDEFVVFLPNISGDEGAARKAQQICQLTRKNLSLEVQISGSVGIAVYPRDGDCFEALYKKADDTLYYVKGSGKNNFAFYCADMDENARRDEPSERSTGPWLKGKKRRMLIVDDSKIDFELLSNIFKDEYIIEKAADGSSALIKLHHYGSAISVVLLDLIMPGIDGFTVLEKMQRSAELCSIPAVVVSGAGDRAANLEAIRAGAADFVTKPVDPDLLRLRVRSAVSKAENERLRAQNSFLELRTNEMNGYRTVLEHMGTLVIMHDWTKSAFTYSPSISKYLSGKYDGRSLWHVLLSDMVADPKTVQHMQQLVHDIANDRGRSEGELTVTLKSAAGDKRSYCMHVYKQSNEFGLTDKLIITLKEAAPGP